MASVEQIVGALKARFPECAFEAAPLIVRSGVAGDQHFVRVEAGRLIDVLRFLRDDPAMKFEQLIDLTCVDYLNFSGATDRFGVNYSLLSLTHGHRLWIKCFVNDPAPKLPSATSVWAGSKWMEREVLDMFGNVSDGHPALRPILTWDGFEAHPLRKDYPLRGRGERENYEVVTRESA